MELAPSERYREDITAIRAAQAARAADHEGYRHSPFDWWIFDPRRTSPKTCELCLALASEMFRGDVIEFAFPYHEHKFINAINPFVHPNDRCRLRWAGRTEKEYNTPFGYILPEEFSPFPGEEVLSTLDPSQLEQLMDIFRTQYEV